MYISRDTTFFERKRVMFTDFISLIMHDESEKNSDSAVIVHSNHLAQPQL